MSRSLRAVRLASGRLATFFNKLIGFMSALFWFSRAAHRPAAGRDDMPRCNQACQSSVPSGARLVALFSTKINLLCAISEIVDHCHGCWIGLLDRAAGMAFWPACSGAASRHGGWASISHCVGLM
jgi:hypothetical protein